MTAPLYQTGELAKKASISIRTLRYYDQTGLLSPSQHSESGYRLYTEEDLHRLQYILALKYLGFSLEEIKACLQTSPQDLSERLAQQRAMLLDKRAELDLILRAVEASQRLLQQNPDDPEALSSILHVYQAEHKPEWVRQHLTPAQRLKMRDLYESSYSEEARHKLQTKVWTDETRRLHHEQYDEFRTKLQTLTAQQADPASAESQHMAHLLTEINARVSQGDPAILEGMKKSWTSYNALPEQERPPAYHFTDEERDFLKKAMTHFHTARATQQPPN
ncbi:MerR family transcriptional regulator [Tumebacillus sp. ITR2]|uniref:MerR family transcriptional regulator n=1 Tax=Tumebacillus amylolyticus TaxID=2801339 RepID=A0ABS1J6A6_9BACL|nr:MerR family transcriptional regulator [Tumebacillus amylolyticus]MBL0385198.1 MerR family transcriptional regulator [Tumebacillus amylolyticus]